MEESLYFSDIETDEISLQVNEPLNTIISTEDSKNEIEQVIAVEEQYLTSHISPLNSDNKPKRELPKTSSIGSLYKDIHQEVVTAKDENKLELSPENVIILWREFLADNKDKLQNAFLSAAQEQSPQLIEDKVTFTASNNISLEMLQLHKMDITTYFRKRTTSVTVMPDFILQRNESAQKNYKSSKDRLKEMIDTNAAILKLIEKFDLNID